MNCERLEWACAVERRRFPVGASHTQQLLLQPEVILDLPKRYGRWAKKNELVDVGHMPSSRARFLIFRCSLYSGRSQDQHGFPQIGKKLFYMATRLIFRSILQTFEESERTSVL